MMGRPCCLRPTGYLSALLLLLLLAGVVLASALAAVPSASWVTLESDERSAVSAMVKSEVNRELERNGNARTTPDPL